ncbi:MAG: SagB/ThcOx family dehydrogenase [Selenomonadaceae bacterium]|nr:SagB/ThcOx family dehydrogenase [Selenomonadaceae bacterium]
MKNFFIATLAAVLMLSTTTVCAAQELPDDLTVMQALSQRKTSRNFVDSDLSEAQLLKILWAANGINRPDGKRVNPAALGVYSVEVYAVTRTGIYRYDEVANKLNLIAAGDYRMSTTTGQAFVGKAAVNLVYVETPDAWLNAKHRVPSREDQLAFANIAVGSMIQSVALAAQSEGLGNCVRGSINRDEFAKVAKLSADKTILLAQSVGKTA